MERSEADGKLPFPLPPGPVLDDYWVCGAALFLYGDRHCGWDGAAFQRTFHLKRWDSGGSRGGPVLIYVGAFFFVFYFFVFLWCDYYAIIDSFPFVIFSFNLVVIGAIILAIFIITIKSLETATKF